MMLNRFEYNVLYNVLGKPPKNFWSIHNFIVDNNHLSSIEPLINILRQHHKRADITYKTSVSIAWITLDFRNNHKKQLYIEDVIKIIIKAIQGEKK